MADIFQVDFRAKAVQKIEREDKVEVNEHQLEMFERVLFEARRQNREGWDFLVSQTSKIEIRTAKHNDLIRILNNCTEDQIRDNPAYYYSVWVELVERRLIMRRVGL